MPQAKKKKRREKERFKSYIAEKKEKEFPGLLGYPPGYSLK